MISNGQFAKSLSKCFKFHKFPRKIAVALSGGVDSLCLTYLLTKFKQFHNPSIDITAITIDHSYREGSYEEAKEIGRLINGWGVKHIIKTLEYDQNVREIGNFEEVAREKRYETFHETCEEIGCQSLLVGHNMNDQLETFLLRLQQNSSLFGLRGLQHIAALPVKPNKPAGYSFNVSVYRPLLEFDRIDIEETCIKNNIDWFEDYSNGDIHLTKRNLFRYLLNDVIPQKQIMKKKDDSLDSYDVVSKDSLVETHREIMVLTDHYQDKVNELKTYLLYNNLFKVDPRNSSATINIPFEKLDSCNTAILSRFLYQSMYPLSSVKYFHWSYAKLERQAVPKIMHAYMNGVESFKLTILNVLFKININRKSQILEMSLFRQPIQRDEFEKISLTIPVNNKWSPWLLFDRRYWIRLKSNSGNKSIKIIPYNNFIHKSRLRDVLETSDKTTTQTEVFNASPLILCDDEILALPTFQLYFNDDFVVECILKE